jgi:hypothetical protein
VQAFGTDMQRGLMIERSDKYKGLVSGLARFTGLTVTQDDILLATVALGADNQFNEFQSVSDPSEIDAPSELAGPRFRTLADFLARIPNADVNAQTGAILLNRAEAATCAGCHQTSPRDGITPSPALVKVHADGGTVLWPDVNTTSPGGFVHVNEDRSLSPALENHFLPVRRYVLGRHLCSDLGPAVTASIASASPPPNPMRFVDRAVSEFVSRQSPAAGTSEAASGGQALRSASTRLSPADRASLRAQVRSQIAQAREAERRKEGAFVPVRRPH